jgi:outer membrane protein assembly factor BamA
MYESLKKRMDRKFMLVQGRSIEKSTPLTVYGPTTYRRNVLEGLSQFSFPFHRYSSVRVSGMYRTERLLPLSTDLYSIYRTGSLNHLAALKTEFVYDNTRDLGPNLLSGTRWKVSLESYALLSPRAAPMNLLQFDYRRYVRLYKNMIWTGRTHLAAGLGGQKTLFLLGGVENWLLPRRDNLLPPANESFAYEALGAPLRGFWQNSRNGSNMALFNTEVRCPLIQMLSRTPVASDFWRNLSLISFFDMGTAWSGVNPFSEENPLNVRFYENGPVRVKVITSRDPILLGYGYGLRMRVLGYYLRIDRAQGIDDGQVLRPIWHFSLNFDF